MASEAGRGEKTVDLMEGIGSEVRNVEETRDNLHVGMARMTNLHQL